MRAAQSPVLLLPLQGKKIMVVDDDDDCRELIAMVLQRAGASLCVACSAEDALADLMTAAVDLLVSDLGMPVTDGYALVARLRAREAPGVRLPVMAVTAFAASGDRARALRSGFDAYTTKPIDPSALVGMVAQLLEGAPLPYVSE